MGEIFGRKEDSRVYFGKFRGVNGRGCPLRLLGSTGRHPAGFDGAGLADIGVEDVVCEADHHIKDGAPVDVGLVVAGGAADVEGIPPGGIPLGVDAVEDQGDLTVDVGPQRRLRPGNTE